MKYIAYIFIYTKTSIPIPFPIIFLPEAPADISAMAIANLGNGEVDQEDSSPSPGGTARDPPLLLLTDFPIGDDLSHWIWGRIDGSRVSGKSPLGWKPMKGKLHRLSAARIVHRSLWPVADLTLIGVAPSGVGCNK